MSDCKHPASQIDYEIDAVTGESYYWCEACGREIDGGEYDAKCEAEEMDDTDVDENKSHPHHET